MERRLEELAGEVAISAVMDDPPDYYRLIEEQGELRAALYYGDYTTGTLPKCEVCGARVRHYRFVHREIGDSAEGRLTCNNCTSGWTSGAM